jgi:cation transport regulator ChaC
VKLRYFAYGSNLLQEEIARWCSHATALAVAKLNGHRLDFTRYSEARGGGVADIVPDDDDAVWGVLYEVPENELRRLDQKEGVPRAYERHTVETEMAGGRRVRAMTYVVVDKSHYRPPSATYLGIMLKGARSRKLPDAYIEKMESFSEDQPDSSERVRDHGD